MPSGPRAKAGAERNCAKEQGDNILFWRVTQVRVGGGPIEIGPRAEDGELKFAAAR